MLMGEATRQSLRRFPEYAGSKRRSRARLGRSLGNIMPQFVCASSDVDAPVP